MTLETPRAVRLAAGVAVGALATAGPAYAQVGMSATSLSGGFMPSPQVFDLSARGADPADTHVSGCPGYADLDGPGFRVSLSDGYSPLRFYLDSVDGSGLLLRGPDGISRCGTIDDNGIAAIAMGNVQNGDYHIWPLSPEPDVSVDTRLLVSEYELQNWEIRPPEPPDPDNLEPPLLAGATIDLDAAGRQELAAGSITGSFPAWDLEPGCSGNIDPEAAHVTANLSLPVDELSFNIEAERDAIMMVLTPDGVWLCNDDARGVDPAVTAAPAPEGRYYILGGTFGQDITTEATFFANLGSPIWSDGQVGYDYEREFGGWDDEGDIDTLAVGGAAAFDWIVRPEEGAAPITAEFPLTGTVAASNFQSDCWGQITPTRPDFVVEVGNDGDPLALRVRSDADTTLLVVDPSGAIECNDDTYGLDPEIAYPAADAGEYDVWVGSWGSGDGRAATLTVSRAPGADTGDMISTGTDHDGWDDFAGDDDIFVGVQSMMEIWEVMIADLAEFGTIVMADSVVADGVEGLEVTGLSIDDPDFGEPVTIAGVRVNAFDVAGVGEGGEPTYFDIEIVEIDYMGIAQVAAMDMGVPLADMETGTASIIARVMPEDGDTDLGLSIEISDSISLAFDATIEGEPAGFESMESALIRTATLSITDMGFIRDLIDSQAALFGLSKDDILEVFDDGMGDAPFPVTADDPRGSVFLALRELIANSDAGGVFSVAFSPDRPARLEEIGLALMDPSADAAEALNVSAHYTLD